MYKLFFTVVILLFTKSLVAQLYELRTKEGKPFASRRELVNSCLDALKKDRTDAVVLSICECRIEKLDLRFTIKQINKAKSIASLIEKDSILQKELNKCITNTNNATLVYVEARKDSAFIKCVKSIFKSTTKTLDSANVSKYCNCQLELIKSKQLKDKEYENLKNLNSILFYEFVYKCGNPYLVKGDRDNGWKYELANDIAGPLTDTISLLTINGMSYVRIKTGSLLNFWLFDTGASDLLIGSDIEATLKKENYLNDANYLGTAEYEIANSEKIICRQYKVNQVKLGKYTINNVIISAQDGEKKILVGRSLLNKFRYITVDNVNDKLILIK